MDEGDLTADYNEFYNDVLPELAECGKVIQFKVYNTKWTIIVDKLFLV